MVGIENSAVVVKLFVRNLWKLFIMMVEMYLIMKACFTTKKLFYDG